MSRGGTYLPGCNVINDHKRFASTRKSYISSGPKGKRMNTKHLDVPPRLNKHEHNSNLDRKSRSESLHKYLEAFEEGLRV